MTLSLFSYTTDYEFCQVQIYLYVPFVKSLMIYALSVLLGHPLLLFLQMLAVEMGPVMDMAPGQLLCRVLVHNHHGLP